MELAECILDRIRAKPLTGKKLQVAKYILDNFVEASFLTAAQLAERVQVSEPTVIRLAADLGYTGYPGLKDALREKVQDQLTTVQRLRGSRRRNSARRPAIQSLITETGNLDSLVHSIDLRALRKVVQRLVAADKVIVIGYKMGAVLAEYFRMSLKKSVDNTVAVTRATGMFQEELAFAGSSSIVVGISFPRYTQAIVRDFQQAREQRICTVAITDSELSPLVEHADHCLLAPCSAVSYIDAFAAPIGLLCAIATEVSIATQDELTERLAKIEELWKANKVFL